MAVFPANATAPGVLFASTPLFTNRFQPLEELPHSEETTNPPSKFQAQGVYKPPHMRTPSESVASVIESDAMANSTHAVHPAHGPSLDHEKKGTSCPHTPHSNSAPGSAVFGFGEVKKKIHEELSNVRKAMEDMEVLEKEFLKEEARFEHEVQVLRSAGLTDEEIRGIIGWTPENFPSRPPSAKPIDVNVGICLHALASGREDLP